MSHHEGNTSLMNAHCQARLSRCRHLSSSMPMFMTPPASAATWRHQYCRIEYRFRRLHRFLPRLSSLHWGSGKNTPPRRASRLSIMRRARETRRRERGHRSSSISLRRLWPNVSRETPSLSSSRWNIEPVYTPPRRREQPPPDEYWRQPGQRVGRHIQQT